VILYFKEETICAFVLLKVIAKSASVFAVLLHSLSTADVVTEQYSVCMKCLSFAHVFCVFGCYHLPKYPFV
jgi:hypothetical protein